MSLKTHIILKFGTLKMYRMELVGQNAQNTAKVHDFGLVIEAMSWPRMWLVGLTNTTKVTLLAYRLSFKWTL